MLLAIAVAGMFGRALGFEFVYDDRVLIEQTPQVGDWATLWTALSHDLFHFAPVRASPYWRPLITLSYYVDHSLGDGAPWAFHADNLVALWLAGLGLFRLLRRHAELTPAAVGTALFVCHPLLVEATVNIASRTDLYCAALLFHGLASRRTYVACALVFAACLSKELAVFAPLVAFALEPRDRRWLWMFLPVLLFLALRTLVVEVGGDASFRGAWESGGRALFLTTRPFLPVPLAPAYEMPTLGGPLGWLVILPLGALSAWRLRGVQAGGAALLAVCVLPVSGLLQANPRYGDGLMVLGVAGAALLVCRWRPTALAALPFVVLGQLQVGPWRSEATLWETAHERLPESAEIRLNYARTLVDEEPGLALALLEAHGFEDERKERERRAVQARAYLIRGEEKQGASHALMASADDAEAVWASSIACVYGDEVGDACLWAMKYSSDPNVFNAAALHAEDAAERHRLFVEACRLSPSEGPFCNNARRSELELRPSSEDPVP